MLGIATAASPLHSQTAIRGVAAPATLASHSENRPLHIFGPGVLAAEGHGNVYVAVPDGIFKIDSSGTRVRAAGRERDWRYSGDGGPALGAGMNPRSVALDGAGDLYLADAANNRIRKISAATWIVTTVAGNGARGYSGDGGPAISAQLDGPTGVAVDAAGNVYISDGTADGRNRIRKVAASTGVITSVAGNGSQGFSGDGGPATEAQFSSLGGLAVDEAGNLYIADNFNHRIRKMTASTGVITTIAGNGQNGASGDGGLATNAQLSNPLSVAVDSAGDLYIADSGNRRIRKVTASTGEIASIGDENIAYRNGQHSFPCAIAVDAGDTLYIADSGISRVRRISANAPFAAAGTTAVAVAPERTFGMSGGFTINVTYDNTVPSAAKTAFNNLVAAYESVFTTNITVNIDVAFGQTGLGESETQQAGVTYSDWRSAMIANANANPGNTYAAGAAASLPLSDPIGQGDVVLTTANARALGLSAFAAVDSSLTFSNTIAFEYNGVAASGKADFLDVAAHELDEALGIGSALTGLMNNAPIPTDGYAAEDYFRYGAANTRAITTSPNATVYFSYNGGMTNVAQFNQAYSAEGDTNLDRNDWIYGNSGCPAANAHVQDAILCLGQAVAIGTAPETTVLSALGYDSSLSQTINFPPLSNVTYGMAPFSISATASSGLQVIFTSTTTGFCTVSGNTVTIVAAGTCSITANQPGNATYSAAPPVSQSFVINKAPQTIAFGPLGNVVLGVAPFQISAMTTSGLAAAFASITTGVCTVSGNTVTIVAAGTCSIKATQPGNANYSAAPPNTQSFMVTSYNVRSFVSTTGSDSNNCSANGYCRTLAAALAATNPGGEIVIVDSGGYGPATITQPVIITATGIDASINATSGSALTINTGGNVTLTGLGLHGQASGTHGILVQKVGILRLVNMTIENFSADGIHLASAGELVVLNSAITDNGNDGLLLANASDSAYVENTSFDQNQNAAVEVFAGSATIADSSAENNTNAFVANGGTLTLFNDRAVSNGTALVSSGGGALYFAACVISNNATAYNAGSGSVMSGSSVGTSLIEPGQATIGTLSATVTFQ